MKRAVAILLLLAYPAKAADDGGTSFALFDACGCPPAPPPWRLGGDAGEIYSPERIRRVNCALECAETRIRVLEEAGLPQKSTVAWVASAAVCLFSAVLSAYSTNRSARGLPLWPP